MINYDLKDIVECLTTDGFAKEIYLLGWYDQEGSFSVSDLNSPVSGISNAYELLVVTESNNKQG